MSAPVSIRINEVRFQSDNSEIDPVIARQTLEDAIQIVSRRLWSRYGEGLTQLLSITLPEIRLDHAAAARVLNGRDSETLAQTISDQIELKMRNIAGGRS